ncbi:hypothetical protein ACQKNO_01300 [Bacillus paramycoides]|uniref:hypothetical protein n=1 Tax=Bacillus paramycoides TaxID=2026194 RepID=UPI003D078323
MASTKNFSSGFREIDYRFELLDSDNSVIGDVANIVKTAEITNNSFSSIQRTAKFDIKEYLTSASTVTQLVSKSFWQGDVLPSQWKKMKILTVSATEVDPQEAPAHAEGC